VAQGILLLGPALPRSTGPGKTCLFNILSSPKWVLQTLSISGLTSMPEWAQDSTSNGSVTLQDEPCVPEAEQCQGAAQPSENVSSDTFVANQQLQQLATPLVQSISWNDKYCMTFDCVKKRWKIKIDSVCILKLLHSIQHASKIEVPLQSQQSLTRFQLEK
jgi:hypothetical protein